MFRFVEELESLINTSHDNVIDVLGWTQVENIFGIIMEHKNFGSLDSLLLQNALPTPLLCYRMCYDIACGIAHLHSFNDGRGIVHGNIKPENILLSETLNCKLAGVAEMVFNAAEIDTGTTFNSTSFVIDEDTLCEDAYAPPEEFLTGKKLLAYDVYSFSVIATELLCGKRLAAETDGQSSDLFEIGRFEEILPSAGSGDKDCIIKLLNTIKSCQNHSALPPTMAEVKSDMENIWEICDKSQIEKEVHIVKRIIRPVIDLKNNYPAVPLAQALSCLISKPGTSCSVRHITYLQIQYST